MKNKIEDLRNHLFSAIERLNNEEITPEELEKEIQRAKAISEVGKVIVDSAKTEVDFMRITKKKYNDFMPEESTSNFLDDAKEKFVRPPAEYSNNGHAKLINGQ
jgi:hypothetical protein